MFNDIIEQIKDGELDDEELDDNGDKDGGDVIVANTDSYQYTSEEIASFNKFVKRSSAAFGYNVYNNENGRGDI